MNDLIKYLVDEILSPICDRYQTRFFHVGNLDIMRPDVANSIVHLCEKTSQNEETRYYLLAGYSAYDEITAAFKKTNNEPLTLNHLWVPEAVDLVVRTSGDYRLSEMLPLQTGFAQLIFSEKYPAELAEQDFEDILLEYHTRLAYRHKFLKQVEQL